MRNIRLLICFFIYGISHGQTHTESIADVVVAGQKAAVATMLRRELTLKMEQRALLGQLENFEGRYQQKIGPMANISNGPIGVALSGLMFSIKEMIAHVEYNMKLRKIETFGIRHGLSSYEAELEKQKGYFDQLVKEQRILLMAAASSGGAGHNYTAFLKLLLRVMEVRGAIMYVDKNVKALMKASWLFSK